MKTFTTIAELRSALAEERRAGKTVGFAPTVCALGFASTGACDSTGALAIACRGRLSTFACTGFRPVNVAPATAVIPPGAVQFA